MNASHVVDPCGRGDSCGGGRARVVAFEAGVRFRARSARAFELGSVFVERCFARVRPRATSTKCWCAFLPRVRGRLVFLDLSPKRSGTRFGASASTFRVGRERVDANRSVFRRAFRKSRKPSLVGSKIRIETRRWPCSGTLSGRGWRLNALWLSRRLRAFASREYTRVP